MTDVALTWDNATGTADWSIVNGEIAVGNDLLTAVIISLFTDKRAPDGAVVPGGDLRGFWGDSYLPNPLGSWLWLLAYEPVVGTPSLLRKAENYCELALKWMISDGVATSVNATAAMIGPGALGISIAIRQPNVKSPIVFQFSWAWAQLSVGTLGTGGAS